jgi:membrane carboxypeptidase/penicillin-binding protein
LMSMTTAYSVFASAGVRHPAILVKRVEDRNGRVLFQASPDSEPVVSDATAFLMTSMLADVVNAGTAYKARQEGFTLPAAGKTGTTNDFNDAWFVGFTPSLAAGVWVGFDQPQTILPNGFAGDLAVPLWANFMKEATKADKPEWFTPPSSVVSISACRQLTEPPFEDCDHQYTEYYEKGKIPPARPRLIQHPLSTSNLVALADVRVDSPRLELAPPEPAQAVKAEVPDASPKADEEPKKKRGFWSKVFGRGKADSKSNSGKKEERRTKNE